MEIPTDRATTTITARVPTTLKGDLEALAKATGRNKNMLMEEALRRFVEIERWQIDLIEDRVRQADAGAFACDEDVARVFAKFNIPHAQKRATG